METKFTNLEALRAIVRSTCGTDPLTPGRARPVVLSRTLLANALLAQGRTEEDVAAEIGYGRSTIHHYRALLRDAQKYNADPAMLGYWNKLKPLLV